MGVLIRWAVLPLVALGALGSAVLHVQAQDVSTPALTAALLFNFVKFTTWPPDLLRNGAPIIVCVGGNDSVADALVQLTQNRTVEGHPLSIRRTRLDRPLTECHVVYGASLDGTSARALVNALADRPILTVSDREDFAERGGVANFYVDGGRMRFAINPAAADRARLRISSRLLTLAKLVGEGRTR
jgi:hypothetical protein